MGYRIPLIDGGTRCLLDARFDDARQLLAVAHRHYTPRGVRLADRLSRAWLERTNNPWLPELTALADRLGEPGLFMLNLSYEWGCTSGVVPSPDGSVSRLRRTLDWPFDGLGRTLAVLKMQGRAGDYYSVTWPGFAGVLTAMAPGRFSVAVNQAKDWHGHLTRLVEWPVARLRFLISGALPPVHLARLACDEAKDYDAAVRLLAETPVCLPAFFVVSGLRPDQGCVIEREGRRAHIHPAPEVSANHWLFPGLQGRRPSPLQRIDRVSDHQQTSHARRAALMARHQAGAEGFDWMTAPVLRPDTKMACVTEAAKGWMTVLGIEDMEPATEISSVTA